MTTASRANPDQVKATERRGSGQAVTDGSGSQQGTITDAQIPATILRDAEAAALYVPLGGTLIDTTALDALTFSAIPTQAEVEALRDEVSNLLATLRVHG